jgi:long-chain fatty acid transport protein
LLDNSPALAPHFYFQYAINPRVSVGAGVYAPYGLASKWPLDFEGRFVSYHAKLSTIYAQPTLAYAFNDRVSVGGGLTIGISSVELNRREDLARVPLAGVPGLTFGALVDPQTDFENTQLKSSGATGVGVNLGVLVKVNERVRAGGRYLTQVTMSYEGDVTFTPLSSNYSVTKPNPLGLPVGTPIDPFVAQVQAALQNQPGNTEIALPAQLQMGVSVDATPRLKIAGDYQWIDWSAFDSVTLDFANPIPPDELLVQNYSDTSGIRLGAQFALRPMFRLSGGYFYNQAAAPDETVTPVLPEAQRNHFTAGFGWDLGPRITIDTAYQFVRTDDRRGRVVDAAPGSLPTVALNSGVYRSRGDLLGITFTYRR